MLHPVIVLSSSAWALCLVVLGEQLELEMTLTKNKRKKQENSRLLFIKGGGEKQFRGASVGTRLF